MKFGSTVRIKNVLENTVHACAHVCCFCVYMCVCVRSCTRTLTSTLKECLPPGVVLKPAPQPPHCGLPLNGQGCFNAMPLSVFTFTTNRQITKLHLLEVTAAAV